MAKDNEERDLEMELEEFMQAVSGPLREPSMLV